MDLGSASRGSGSSSAIARQFTAAFDAHHGCQDPAVSPNAAVGQ